MSESQRPPQPEKPAVALPTAPVRSRGGILLRLTLVWAWLLAWHLLYPRADCMGLLVAALVPALLITLSMAEHDFLRRRAFLQVYLRPTGLLYRLLRGGFALLDWQILKALVLATILLIEVVGWDLAVWIILGLDLVLVATLFPWLARTLGGQVQPVFIEMLTRGYLLKLNAGVLFVAILVSSFYLPHPDFRGVALAEAVQFQIEQGQSGCVTFNVLTRLAAAKDAAAWWAARHWLGTLQDPNLSLFGWVVFLAATGLASWAYSRMLLGILINPRQLSARLRPRPLGANTEHRQPPTEVPAIQPDTRGNGSYALLGFVVVVLVLALLSVYAGLEAGRQLADKRLAPNNLMRIVINGTVSHLPVGAVSDLQPQLQDELEAQQAKAIRDLDTEVDRRIDPIFASVLDQVPDFTDWYYSLQGEYSRYAAVLSGGDVAEYLGERFREAVLQPVGLETALDERLTELNGYADARVRQGYAAVLEKAAALVDAEQVSGLPDQQAAQVEKSLDLGAVVTDHLQIRGSDMAQQAAAGLVAVGVGAAVAKGMGAVVTKKIVASVVSTKSFQAAAALLTKLVAKTAVKETGAAGAALTGVTLCSPSGLVALLCGAVAGAVTWVAVDKVFIELDEAINREAFEAEIRNAILNERDILKAQLKDAYRQVVTSSYQRTAQALSDALAPPEGPPKPPGRFVPADAL